jgi:hypothetical protein
LDWCCVGEVERCGCGNFERLRVYAIETRLAKMLNDIQAP